MNLIRYIGDQVSESGEPIRQLAEISEEIGAPSEELAKQLIEELCEHGVDNVRTISRALGGLARYKGVSLTLKGWEQYEAENAGDSMETTVSSPCSSTNPISTPLFRML